MSDLAEALIGEEEGRIRHVYPDTRGLLTIGIGCLVDPKIPGAGLCDAAIDAQFAHDSAEARGNAARFPHYEELSDVRKAVLVSMCFQLGTAPLHWPDFMAAMTAQNYTAAAGAGRDSLWWREQTPKRAERAMQMLQLNTWLAKT
jgi:GH24 family phage-related lysozyme (muramidase)